MGLHVPVELDGPTARLIRLTQAIQARGDLPDASGKRLVALARSVRMFVEAREGGQAALTLAEIDALGAAATGEAEGLHALLGRHTAPLTASLARR